MSIAAYDGINAPTIRVQFNKLGTWTDVAVTDVRSIHYFRGRQRPDQPIAPGTATVRGGRFSGPP